MVRIDFLRNLRRSTASFALLLAGALALNLTGCAGQKSLMQVFAPFEKSEQQIAASEPSAEPAPAAPETEGVVRISKPAPPAPRIQQVSGEQQPGVPVPPVGPVYGPPPGPYQNPAYCPPGYGPQPGPHQNPAYCPPGYGAHDFNAESLRVPMVTQDQMIEWAKQYPEEYLYDGGDRSNPVHYSEFFREGLDTEDTVVEYTDKDGQRHTKPTNRVAVYAPRFGAVRTITAPTESLAVNNLASTASRTPVVGFENRVNSINHNKSEAIVGLQMDARPSGFEHQSVPGGFLQEVKPGLHDLTLATYQNTLFVRTGKWDQTESARLGYGLQAALRWTRENNPVIISESLSGVEATSMFKAAEIVGIEEKGIKGELRIVKLADKQVASSGDIITFTIRYDNLGDKELFHIQIIDNLTPRLEFVEESGDSDRAGRLDVEDNGEGSLVLKFVLDDPLPGRTGGVVTFKAKVR